MSQPPAPAADLEAELADLTRPVDEAKDQVRRARAEVKIRKQALLEHLTERLRDVPTDAAIAHALYWGLPDIAVGQLARAASLRPSELRSLAGPLPVERTCDVCDDAFVALQSSRSSPGQGEWLPRGAAGSLRGSGAHGTWILCPSCRERVRGQDLPPFDPTQVAPMWSSLLDGVGHAVREHGCDKTLELTRQVAHRLGLHEDGVVEAVDQLGGHCDCEVVNNVPLGLPGTRHRPRW